MKWIVIATKMISFLFIFCLFSVFITAATISYTYDSAGRLIKADYGDGKTISYTYDPAGNLLNRTVFVPCFDWPAFAAQLPNWPDPETVLTLLDDVECPKKVKQAAPDS